jgi:hypothetical protein
MTTTHKRDADTVRSACGVRLSPDHILSKSVHSFRTWTADRELVTWCSIPVDLAHGGIQTTETITCVTCAEASWLAFKGVGR